MLIKEPSPKVVTVIPVKFVMSPIKTLSHILNTGNNRIMKSK